MEFVAWIAFPCFQGAQRSYCLSYGGRLLVIFQELKRPFRDDMGPLALVKQLRNRLAHGSISFAQCAEDVTVERLVELKNKTVDYLKEVVGCFASYIDSFEYLHPEKRPA